MKLLKYFEVAKINFLETLAYPIALIGRLPLLIFTIFALSKLYTTTYGTAKTDIINNLTLTETIWILCLVQILYASGNKKISRIISLEVITGTFAYSVNKPYSYTLFHFASYLGKIIPSLFFNLVINLTILLLITEKINITLLTICMGILPIILGFVLIFLIEYVIGLSAFWIEDTEPIDWVYSKTSALLGGAIVPLTFFPGTLETIAELLPFGLTYYAPAKAIVQFNVYYYSKILLLQIFWIIIISLAARYIFKKGVKNVSLGGG